MTSCTCPSGRTGTPILDSWVTMASRRWGTVELDYRVEDLWRTRAVVVVDCVVVVVVGCLVRWLGA